MVTIPKIWISNQVRVYIHLPPKLLKWHDFLGDRGTNIQMKYAPRYWTEENRWCSVHIAKFYITLYKESHPYRLAHYLEEAH